ncbi:MULTISPECIES: hypothetical protein [Pseudomonas]|nr:MULTISPECIES: hypothetical protein [Pseudomonas]
MRYYLETNALRALGGSVGNNKELLKQSYTSTFSLFELTKGIGRSRDSDVRLGVLKALQAVELSFIDFMPFEMMELAFGGGAYVLESEAVKDKIRSILSNTELTQHNYDKIIERYEFGTKVFQTKVTMAYAVPASPPKTVHLDLDKMFSPERETPDYLKKLPKNLHPSRVIMECMKQKDAPATYKALYPDSELSSQEILSIYNNSLDLYFFASFGYDLKRKCLREAASKNDLLDVLHTIYLVDHDNVIVSNDAIFSTVLPDINTISVEQYRKLI